MIKGGGDVGPASHYRGSLCLHVATKAKAPTSMWPPHMPNLRAFSKIQLTVRMFQGMYLRELSPKELETDNEYTKIKVFVQVPSGGLPIKLDEHQEKRLPKYTRAQDEEGGPIRPLNPNILQFDGFVDNDGQLFFDLDGDEERRQLAKRCHISR